MTTIKITTQSGESWEDEFENIDLEEVINAILSLHDDILSIEEIFPDGSLGSQIYHR